jgi:hypothetical protein
MQYKGLVKRREDNHWPTAHARRYEFYHDIIQPGQYLYKIKALHETYGPVIRINPDELHVSDPEFFGVLFAGGSHRRERVPFHAQGLALEDSVLTTISHDLHRKRRAGLSSFFSMQSTRKLLPLVKERVDKLTERLVALRGTGKLANLEYAFSAFTNGEDRRCGLQARVG